MPRCFRPRSILPGLCLAAACLPALVGCNYSSNTTLVLPGESTTTTETTFVPAPAANPGTAPGPNQAAPRLTEQDQEKAAILDSIIKLIQAAATQPGGGHFGNATKNLNQYFEGTPSSDFALDPKAREYLLTQLPPEQVAALESSTWALPDARHLEDCMLYQGIASRVGGVGDDLTRTRRVFDWMVQQIQLVPAGRLAAPGIGQAQARPYDVLLRGLATEGELGWSERGWVFLSLCRQLGLDAGLVTYTPTGSKTPMLWCVAVLIDKKAYLFDPRIGLPIPDARGDGVATLDEALTDPGILDRMDLHIANQPAYTSRAALLASATKIGIWIDSSLHLFTPRMRLLQQSLAGKNLTILYRDPAEQRDRFAEALGPRLGAVSLWQLPIFVEHQLFTNPQFVQSTAMSLTLFRPELPLIYARMKQLRGETADAIQAYVAFRFAENALLAGLKNPDPAQIKQVREIQTALDVYATYFLGMCHLEQKHAQQAEFFFEKTLQMLPEPGPRRLYYYMFRWGAQANLARLKEGRGEIPLAIAYYSQSDPTTQRHGNLLRARDLVWRDVLSSPSVLLPAAPPDTLTPETPVIGK